MQPAERLQPFLDRRRLVAGAVVLQWLTITWVGVRADHVDVGGAEALSVAVLVPIAIYAAFAVAAHVGGVALGAWTLLVWVSMPWVAPLFTLDSYDATLRDDVLPHVVGLTAEPGFIEGVALLTALALVFERPGRARVALAAGLVILTGVAVLWLLRLPIPDLSRDAFDGAMAGLREYFWSQRVLQWLPLAGVVAVARRSIPLALLLGGWLGAYAVIRWAHPGGGYENGEIFRELLPALPAFVLLAAAMPLLVPTLAARLGPLARPAG